MRMATRYAVLIPAFVALLAGAPALAAPDRLVLAIGGEPDTGYDPLLGWGRYGHPLFQSTLLKRDADLVTQPDLATQWRLSDDRLTWTITIRPDVRFSDGTPLTADDVVFTFAQAAQAGGALDLSVFDSAVALDPTTLEIRLKRPWITFTENFYTLGIVPAASYGPGYGRRPVGSGPYRLVSWTEGEQLMVEANPHYYGPPLPFGGLTFVFTGEDTSLAAARAGAVDLVSVPASAADAAPAGMRQLVVGSVDNRGLSFPMTDNPVTADKAVRQAINLGIDRQVLVDVALFGHGTPAFGPADGLPWSNPEAAIAYDLAAATALLDSAGWLPGVDGVRAKDGVRAAFPIAYPASDSTRQALALTLAEQLKPLGIAATATGRSWEEIARLMHSEPVLFGWGSHTPLEVYSLYQSSWGGVDFYNPGHFASAAVDAAFAAAQNAESLEASYPFWQQAEWDGATGFGPKGEAAWAWLVNLDHIYYVDDCLDLGPTQIEPHGHGWPLTAGIETWSWTCD